MPLKLNPSGYSVFFHGETDDNLVAGIACPSCKRVVGHHFDCPDYKHKETGESSRPKLFNAASVLWAKYPDKSFITFTLPSRAKGIYQASARCTTTGDLAVTAKFSKVLEAWALRQKRAGRGPNVAAAKPLSYVWISEPQMKRKQKFGGIGDLHFHLVVNVKIKDNHGRVVDRELLTWLQNLWCEHLGESARNCVHVDPIPDGINSIPGYLTKYLGKGSPRFIVSRRFGATRDLTRYKPITLHTNSPPTADLVSSVDIKTPNGFEVCLHFYNTRQILEEFGSAMMDESRFVGVTRAGKDFTPQAIQERAEARTRSKILEAYQDEPLPDVWDSHTRMVSASRTGLSNST